MGLPAVLQTALTSIPGTIYNINNAFYFFWTPTKSFDFIHVLWSLAKREIIQKQNFFPPNVEPQQGTLWFHSLWTQSLWFESDHHVNCFPSSIASCLFINTSHPNKGVFSLTHTHMRTCADTHTHTLVVSVTQAIMQKTAGLASSHSCFHAVAIGQKNLKLLRAPWELFSPTQSHWNVHSCSSSLDSKAFTLHPYPKSFSFFLTRPRWLEFDKPDKPYLTDSVTWGKKQKKKQ